MSDQPLEIKSPEQKGLQCRHCGGRYLPVDNTRKVNGKIIRYRRCRHCGQRMTTCERAIG